MHQPSFTPSTWRIVVIENHPVVRVGLATFLAPDGYDLMFHPGAAGALAVIRQVQPTVVLIDLHLEYPAAGLDVVRALRAEPATRAIPVVMWSSDPELERHVATLQAPAVTVVSKFADPTRLRAAIARAAAPTDGPGDDAAPEHVVG